MQNSLRTLLVLAAVAIPAAAFGEKPSSGGPSAAPTQIVLYPAPEPRPALKYQLLPPFLERRPGNAAVWWNRLPAEQMRFFRIFYEKGGPWERIEKWMEIPLGDPREREYRKKELAQDARTLRILRASHLMSDMRRAAQFESCDWELPVREGRIIATFLPEASQTRMFARLLAAKAHLEIVEGKYDEAVRTFQTGYALARHIAQGGFLVCALVGLTNAQLMSDQVQQLIQLPDAPNLYWALSALPRPLVDFRLAAEIESNLLYLQFPELRDLDKKKLSPGHWNDLMITIAENVREYNKYFGETQVNFSLPTSTSSLLRDHPEAKRYLVEHGHTAAEVEAMPVAQVVLLYSVKIYDELSDEQFKWFFIPAAEAGKGPQRAERELRDAIAAKREIIPLAETLIPWSMAAKKAETRLQWNIAVLRVFEALRLHAANHGGQWPDHLGDITEVPIPVNPYDGKPFIYERHGDRATLTSESGPRKSWGVPWRYEITFKQKPTSKK